MKSIKIFILSTLILFISFMFTSSNVFAAFSQADLTGTWYGQILTSGSEETWEYDTITIDSNGHVSVQYTGPNGDTGSESDAAVVTIENNGVISDSVNSSFHGVMSSDKNMIVFNDTWGDSVSYALTILIRDGGSYSQSDLTGTWYAHTLTSGYEETWEHGTITVESDGYVSMDLVDASGNTDIETRIAKANLSSDGFLTVEENPSLHGVMSPDKNMVVFTETWDDEGYISYALTVLVKGGGSFTQLDSEGSWYGHALVSGSWEGWERSTIEIDSEGTALGNFIASDGNSDSGSINIAVSADGIITSTDSQTAHGVMNLDKDIAVITETSDAGEYNLMVLIKGTVPAADFSASPLSGKKPLQVTFTDSSLGDVTGWSWDFGDGSTSTDQNPSHTYSKTGKYTVSLTATGPEGSDVETKTDYISVMPPGMSWLPILLDE